MLTDCWRCGRTWLIVSCLVNILNLTLLTLLAIIPGIHKIQDHKADNNSVLSYFGFWFWTSWNNPSLCKVFCKVCDRKSEYKHQHQVTILQLSIVLPEGKKMSSLLSQGCICRFVVLQNSSRKRVCSFMLINSLL